VLPPPAEGSVEVAARVALRRSQTGRYAAHGVRTNAEANAELLDAASCTPDEPGRRLLAQPPSHAPQRPRYHRVLRVSRTIADLGGSEGVGRVHVAEALSYRRQAPRA
jgi:magnesium chelatase family protein